jgi:hypothetical protein
VVSSAVPPAAQYALIPAYSTPTAAAEYAAAAECIRRVPVADRITASPLAGPFAMSSESVGAVLLSHSSPERCR